MGRVRHDRELTTKPGQLAQPTLKPNVAQPHYLGAIAKRQTSAAKASKHQPFALRYHGELDGPPASPSDAQSTLLNSSGTTSSDEVTEASTKLLPD